MSCQKRFLVERNLEPPIDWEPPAKIPRLPARGAAGGLRAYAAAAAAGVNPANLAGYQVAASKAAVAAAAGAYAYHPLLPKSALLNTLGYSVLPAASAGAGKTVSGAGKAAQQSAAASMRLAAELHVVASGGGGGQRSGTPPQVKGQAAYRQAVAVAAAAAQSSLYLSPSYTVPNNQIYQVTHRIYPSADLIQVSITNCLCSCD